MSISNLEALQSIVTTGIGSGNGNCEENIGGENIGGESFMSVTAIIRTRKGTN